MTEQAVHRRIHKKSLIVLLIVALILLGAASLGYIVWSHTYALNSKPQSALLSVITGTPEVSTDGQNFQHVKDGDQVFAGSTIKTDSKSRALLVFSDNSVVTVDFSSEIQLDTINQDRIENDITIIQKLGKIFSQVERIVGVQENYQVKAKGVIAAVRGTKFGTGILENGHVRVYVVESKVAVSLVDPLLVQSLEELILQSGKQAILDPVKALDGNQFAKDQSDYQSGDSDWDKLNKCLSATLDGLQPAKQTTYEYIQAKYQELITACAQKSPTDATGQPPTPTKTTSSTPAAVVPPATILTITDNGAYTDTTTIACNWNATDADKYNFTIGSNPGYTDLVNWQLMTTTSYSNSSLPLVYGTKYFCTVLPTGAGGTNGWKTSDGIIYDPVTGNFRGSYTNNGGANGWSVGDSAVVNSIGAIDGYTDVNGYFSLICNKGTAAGKYFDGKAWGNTPTWVQYNKSMDGFAYFSNANPIPAQTTVGRITTIVCSDVTLGEKLVNDKTGKLLQQL